MELQAIREATHQVPFQPFTLRLADGRAIEVRHRDFIAMPEMGRRVVVTGAHDEFVEIIDSLLIVSLTFTPAPAR